jgi:hypothetical protein
LLIEPVESAFAEKGILAGAFFFPAIKALNHAASVHNKA